jgi:2'-5' RNA ligase
LRLFVAVYPPADACAHLAAVADTLAVGRAASEGVNARLAPRANWHVTLAFLGDVADDRCDAARAALESAAECWRAGGAGPPELCLAGGGRFGRGRFTILWVGMGGQVDALVALGTAVRRELRRARLPHDRKPLRPHMTLARPGDRVDVRADLAVLAGYEGPRWPATQLRLVRSHPGPRPTYDHLATAVTGTRP